MSNTPDNPSDDYKAMLDYWKTVDDLYRGADAVRAGGERYLPRYENETSKQYKDRLKWARYTNVYGDILDTLASKPFSEELKVNDAPATFDPLIEDIDGQGNNLHNFAARYFKAAINSVVDWIYVDYTQVDPTTLDASGRLRRKSVSEERQSGARPYWVRVSALEMIAVYSAMIGGVETFVHARMREVFTERDGWGEKEIVQIRELNRELIYDEGGRIVGLAPATWTIWRPTESNQSEWEVFDSGAISIEVIPLVPLVIGEREGTSWRMTGAMKDCADLQIDLYQQETGLQNARQLTAFPMLSADGISPELDPKTKKAVPAPVGPRAVLYGGRNSDGTGGSWKYIEITATSLKFLAEEIKSTIQELRELGKQPLTAQSGNLTTVTTAFAAQKGNSAVQAWALALKDALEQAFVFTAMWMRTNEEPTISIFMDFLQGIGEDDGFDKVLEMRSNQDLSRQTTWEEAERRGILGDDFDPEEEEKRLREEGESEPGEDDIRDALGNLNNSQNPADLDPDPTDPNPGNPEAP